MKHSKKYYLLGALSLSLALGFGGISASAKAKSTPVNGNKQQTFDVVLKSRNASQLTSYTYAVTNKNSANYRKYLTPAQYAQKFGQSNATVKQFQNYFKKYHLKVTVFGGNSVLVVKGKTKDIQKAFHVKLVNKAVSGGEMIQNKADKINLPKSLYKNVMSITGYANVLDTTNKKKLAYKSNLVKQPAALDQTTNNTSTDNTKNLTPQKFINRYNVSALYNSGQNLGQGKTVGIISFANFNPSDATKFWAMEGIPVKANRISQVHTDGNKGTWDNMDETTLDVEQAGAVAPQANIRVYTSNQNGPISMINNLAMAIGENKVDSLSTSWGKNEKIVAQEQKLGIVPKQYFNILNLLFKQAAVQGISSFVAAGDNGAYEGATDSELTTGLAVSEPATSPYVTSTGGTSLPATYKIKGQSQPYQVKKERAWADEYLYPEIHSNKKIPGALKRQAYFTAGGGGFSTIYKNMPAYQKGVSGTQTFRAEQRWNYSKGKFSMVNPVKVVTGTKQGRNLPDVSANADETTGYNVYMSKANNGGGGQMKPMGGTSIVSPQMAAASVLMSQSNGARVGFWNPTIYKFAQSSDSPFTPLDSAENNTNLYYTGQPGKLYNQATGLGTIDFGKLNQQFKN
ncbi:S53 family peptidase [Lentilactobacillus senioris]|uniref:S53 family peptidase n=1 Tax=Lentilactobacillus senioris TaxID=931534 RepID=UPI00227ED2CD|nr:S53 family peptidase [Lentilactobacillus senioris]MCY9805931.1 S53 family peptidase [Lentilactobacillus senioris]